MIELEHTVIDKIEKELNIDILPILSLLYMILIFFCIFDLFNQLKLLRIIYNSANNFPIHALGLTATGITLYKNLKDKKSRKKILFKIKLLFSTIRNHTILDGPQLLDDYSEEEVQQNLIKFSTDARKILIFAGDVDFLINDKGKSEQFNQIQKFGNMCKILKSERISVDIKLLKELSDSGVKIRTYPKDKPNPGLRGRVKISDDSKAVSMFDKIGDNYYMQEFRNQYLVDMLIQEYNDIYRDSKHPFIKHIIFDLAGVYCDGDIQTFLSYFKEISGIVIENKHENYLCFDSRLNMGEESYTIIDYLENRAKRSFDETERYLLKNKWNSTWTINMGMRDLALKLIDKGYTVAICSNCDQDNGDKYLINGYFDGFDRFLSYEMKKLKPSEEFFRSIIEVYKCEPFECLLIDDHEKNVDEARKFGFVGIKVSRSQPGEDKIAKIKKEFDILSIKYE
ncbi:MAG: HAD-IA family hydrolase [Syntrophales bacterium]|nr:HAD-IA family hydrolase [Syntrophales bacterium]